MVDSTWARPTWDARAWNERSSTICAVDVTALLGVWASRPGGWLAGALGAGKREWERDKTGAVAEIDRKIEGVAVVVLVRRDETRRGSVPSVM